MDDLTFGGVGAFALDFVDVLFELEDLDADDRELDARRWAGRSNGRRIVTSRVNQTSGHGLINGHSPGKE